MTGRARWRGLVVLAVVVGATGPLAAQADTAAPAARWAAITYLSGATAYLEVGRQQGVREGTGFTVVRGGATIAELTAEFVSSGRTAARITSSSATLTVGDSVWYLPVSLPEPVPLVASGVPAARRAASRRPSPVHGRVGVRYLAIDQGNGRVLRQPGLDLRLDGGQLGGTPLGLAVDLRLQRTSVSGDGGTVPVGRTRVYQAAAQYQRQRNGSRVALGRQFATALAPVGIFDGLAVDLRGARWNGGVLVGTQPDAVTFAPAGSTVEYGAWLQRHAASGSRSPWSVTLGAIGSYDRGEIDREFVYLRGTYASRRVSLHAAQEIDVNRGWRREAAGTATTFTASLVSANLSISDAVQVSGGFDSRQSVRLYRDFVNPEVTFDDALRQGQWGELAVRPSRHLRFSAGMRRSTAGAQGTSRSATGSAVLSRLSPLGLGLRVRATRYTGPLSEGMLSSVALEAAPAASWRVSLNAGQRTSHPPGLDDGTTRLTWMGGDVDLALGRRVYLLLTAYRERGPTTTSLQTHASMTWRF